MENGELIRSFVALEINDEIRNNLGAVQSDLKKAEAHVKWIEPENIHLTLDFLGNISAATVVGIGEQLDIIGAQTRPLSLDIAGLLTLGKRHFIRIICAGVTGDITALSKLQAEIHVAMIDLGLLLDNRPFKAHITIGRIRSAHRINDLKRIIEIKREAEFGPVRVDRVVLMKSVLTSVGPAYSVLKQSFFVGAPGSCNSRHIHF